MARRKRRAGLGARMTDRDYIESVVGAIIVCGALFLAMSL